MSQQEETPLESKEELSIRRDLEENRERLSALRTSCTQICESVLQANSIPFHSVKSRVKSFPSIFEKIVRKKYKPDLFSCTDVVGIRVICLYPSHVDSIADLLRRQFNVLEVVDKRPQSDPERFGYNSVHLLCKLRDTLRSTLPEYAPFADVVFEVQIRTILQEAWAEIQHRLVYKSKVAAPNEVKRIIALLSAHLESADMHFQDIYEKREAYISKLKQAGMPNLEDEPLNIDSLLETIRRQYPWADGWEKIAGKQLTGFLTALLGDLTGLKITTVRQLVPLLEKWSAQSLEASKKRFEKAKAEDAPMLGGGYREWHERTGHYFLPIGLVRNALRREFPDYDAKFRAPKGPATQK